MLESCWSLQRAVWIIRCHMEHACCRTGICSLCCIATACFMDPSLLGMIFKEEAITRLPLQACSARPGDLPRLTRIQIFTLNCRSREAIRAKESAQSHQAMRICAFITPLELLESAVLLELVACSLDHSVSRGARML